MNTTPDNPWRLTWDALDARAWALLNRYGPISPAILRGMSFRNYPRIRLTIDPGGTGPETDPITSTVFELYTDTGERSPVVREVVWRRSADLERARTEIAKAGAIFIRPTVEERYGIVPRDRLSLFLREACGYQVPITWPGVSESITSGPSDSVRYEFFTRGQPPTILRLEWSPPPPWEWQKIAEWYDRLHGFLVECLEKAELRE
jgi:hypothetical protein